MLIFLKGPNRSLTFFISELAKYETSEDKEIIECPSDDLQPLFLRLSVLDSVIGPDTSVFTVNSFGLMIQQNGVNYWERKGARVFNLLVDHPLFYYYDFPITNGIGRIRDTIGGSLASLPGCVTTIVIDKKHLLSVRRFFPDSTVRFIPHGGHQVAADPLSADRPIDILIAQGGGTDVDPTSITRDEETTALLDETYSSFIADPYISEDEAVSLFLEKHGIKVSEEHFASIISMVLRTSHFSAAHDMRQYILKKLLDAGLHVTLCGDGWDAFQDAYPDRLEMVGVISPEECLHYMSKAKILVNTMPIFPAGSHERIFNGMLNGAVLFSNRSTYLEERFREGQDILYYDFRCLDQSIERLKELLNDPERLALIRRNAYEKVNLSDRWSDRTGQYLSSAE